MGNEIKYNLGEKAVVYGISAFVGMVIGFLCLLLSAALMLASDISEAHASPISAISVGIGSIFAGFFASRKFKKNGIVNGLICGTIIYVVIIFMSLFLSESGFSLITILHFVITVLCGAIGGVLGVVSTSKRKF